MNTFILLIILQGTPAMQSFETKEACEAARSWMVVTAYGMNANWDVEGKCIASNEQAATQKQKPDK